jgi:hypothetical protein
MAWTGESQTFKERIAPAVIFKLAPPKRQACTFSRVFPPEMRQHFKENWLGLEKAKPS